MGKSNSAGVDQGDFHYLFGDDFLIVPIHEDKLERTVKLPAGKWRYLFDDQKLIEGPTTITRDFSLEEFPIYIREGSVVPLDVSRPYTGLGDKDSAGLTTWNIYPADGNRFTLHRPDGSSSTAAVERKDKLAIALTGAPHAHLLRVFLDQEPSAVTRDGKPLAKGTDWRYDAAKHRLWVRAAEPVNGRYEIN